MEKHVIKVPKGIRYIGDWEGFYDEFPNCPHIMDKTITGCGFTEWCLTNNLMLYFVVQEIYSWIIRQNNTPEKFID